MSGPAQVRALTASRGFGERVARRSKRRPLRALTTIVVAALLFGGGYAAWSWLRESPTMLTPRCIASDSEHATAIGMNQVSGAATIAAIGVERDLPARAVTIALATAMQESKIRNLDHGDRDSVGMFQQRPSQGWGSAEQLMDPHYATNAFYDELTSIEGYASMEITDAAQAVQRSAFPAAYAQHERLSRLFASALTGYSPAGLTCHLRPVDDPAAAIALYELRDSIQRDYPSVVVSDDAGRLVLQTQDLPGDDDRRSAWAVASWTVLTAQQTGVSRVTVEGQVWQRSDGEQAQWRALPDDDPAADDPSGVVGVS